MENQTIDTQALAVVESSDAVVLRRDPEVVLAEAIKAAQALKKVLDGKPDKVMMNGEQYIENDDWQTIGHFYAISAKIIDTRPVQFGDVSGFEAIAAAITRDGREIGRATAMCLNDEEKWSDRPKYEWHYVMKNGDVLNEHAAEARGTKDWIWESKDGGGQRPKKQKVQVGTAKVPTFQLLSMAQTRASSKVLRMVLGFVPVLAGFKSTPAEELDGATERVPNRPQAQQAHQPDAPARRTEPPVQAQPRTSQQTVQTPAVASAADADLRDEPDGEPIDGEDASPDGPQGDGWVLLKSVIDKKIPYGAMHKKAGQDFTKWTVTDQHDMAYTTIFSRWGNKAKKCLAMGTAVQIQSGAVNRFHEREILNIKAKGDADPDEASA